MWPGWHFVLLACAFNEGYQVVAAIAQKQQQRVINGGGGTLTIPPLSYTKLRFPDHVMETAKLLTVAFSLSETHSWGRALGLETFWS